MGSGGSIAELILTGGYRVVSVVGLAKNSGKTTTLNRIIGDVAPRNVSLGLTSTGRDGEAVDALLHTRKPRIEIGPGVVFTGVLGDLAGDEEVRAGVEVLRTTEHTTALGGVIVARANRNVRVVLVGPSTVSGMARLISSLLDEDRCTLVLVDGSMDRLAAAGSGVSDGVVLAVGAVMGPDMEGVVEKTAHAVGLLTTGRTAVTPPDDTADKRIVALSINGIQWETKCGTLVSDRAWAIQRLEGGGGYLFTTGAVTDETLEELIRRRLFPELIVRDATRLFISRRQKERWEGGGGRLAVLFPLCLIAVTVNPENPEGRGFDGREFLRAMRERLVGVEVFDVMEHRSDS
ncbi:MAG: hypothetical protein JW885_04590 [Deltaproteobacteria bacterium]|nr:hypothetical protein [Candidatus Zymogenaceae bacterium]